MTTAEICALEITKAQKQQPPKKKRKSLLLQNLILKWHRWTVKFIFGGMQILTKQITEPKAIMRVLSPIQSKGCAKMKSIDLRARRNHDFNHLLSERATAQNQTLIINQGGDAGHDVINYVQFLISVCSDRAETGKLGILPIEGRNPHRLFTSLMSS